LGKVPSRHGMVGNYFVCSSRRVDSPAVRVEFQKDFFPQVGFISLEKSAIGMPFGHADDA
jgi:hypothetical protein